jgi:hypothetical protein
LPERRDLPVFCHPISGRLIAAKLSATIAGMDSHDLTPDQCRALAEKFGGMQGELGRVLKRMRERRFPPRDRTLQLTESAFALMQELRMHVHYIGCGQVKKPDSLGD